MLPLHRADQAEQPAVVTPGRFRDYVWFAAVLLVMIAFKAVQLRS